MSKFDWIKLWFFDRREYALQILIEPLRREIEERKAGHRPYKHLYKDIADLRYLHMTGRKKG